MIDNFLDFIELINVDYESEIPEFFHECLDKLELMTADESTVSKKDKMELCYLTKTLNTYLKQDIYGFNSGKGHIFLFYLRFFPGVGILAIRSGLKICYLIFSPTRMAKMPTPIGNWN